MTASGFRVRVIGLVFVFKSASLTLKQVPTCIRKPKTNTFDKSIKFLHRLFWVVLDSFRSFQIVLGHFRSLLDRFSSFQIILGGFSLSLTLVSTHFLPEGHFDQKLNDRESGSRMLIKPRFHPGQSLFSIPHTENFECTYQFQRLGSQIS